MWRRLFLQMVQPLQRLAVMYLTKYTSQDYVIWSSRYHGFRLLTTDHGGTDINSFRSRPCLLVVSFPCVKRERKCGSGPKGGKRLESPGQNWYIKNNLGVASSNVMGSELQLLDILIFAMVAGFLFLRLHRVLGKRTGQEQPPRSMTDEELRSVDVVPLHPNDPELDQSASPELDADLVAGIADLQKADRYFQPGEFLSGVETAFEMIVEAFSRGDIEVLKTLLDDRTLKGFEAEIRRRRAAHEEVNSSLISIDSCEIVEVGILEDRATVRVNIVSKQVHFVRNEDSGEVVEGDTSAVSTINDVWTFARDVRSDDPNWLLAETRPGD